MLFILDLDGTCADGTDRFKKAGPEPSRDDRIKYKAWVDTINADMEFDKAVPGMATLAAALHEQSRLIYLTSREEQHRKTTEDWLLNNGFPTAQVVMRPPSCWVATDDLKEIAIAAVKQFPNEPVLVIDDDESGIIEAMCKRNNYVFLRACSGGQTGGTK